MNDKILGVLDTGRRLHLLIDLQLHRTLCGRVSVLGSVYERTYRWFQIPPAPGRCKYCAKKLAKREREE